MAEEEQVINNNGLSKYAKYTYIMQLTEKEKLSEEEMQEVNNYFNSNPEFFIEDNDIDKYDEIPLSNMTKKRKFRTTQS